MSNPISESAATRRRILFVDDEPNVLDGLRNVLRKQRHEWEMVFALGPEKALELLAQQRFDLVVTDMRMPHLDGVALLTEVKRLQPQAVRMILTGQTEQDSVMKSVFIAHMSLSKPCDHELLKTVISRACNLCTVLASEELRGAVGQVEMLPAAPQTYIALNEALILPECSVGDLVRIIERDVGLCAKILQLVNSAFFGLSRRIGSLTEAITYLGTQTIKTLALVLEAFSGNSGPNAPSPSELLALQEHSVLTGKIARQINVRDKDKAEEFFLAGVLHEVGWLVQVPPLPTAKEPLDRGLLGAYLLGLWGLPLPITEAVAHYRHPSLLPHSEFEAVDAVHIAHHLAAKSEQDIDYDHMNKLGMGREQIQQLRTLAYHSSA